jgi:hypothetical protein
MDTKLNKMLKNVHTQWISTLSLAKRIMKEYSTLLVKMALDSFIKGEATTNLHLLVDVKIMLGLSCILSLLEAVHLLIKFSQLWNLLWVDL